MKTLTLQTIMRNTLLLMMIAVLSACACPSNQQEPVLQSVVESDQQAVQEQNKSDVKQCPAERRAFCTRDYRPVCGVSAEGERKTYANACGACANQDVVQYTQGACAAAR